jgi:hypothetical protein
MLEMRHAVPPFRQQWNYLDMFRHLCGTIAMKGTRFDLEISNSLRVINVLGYKNYNMQLKDNNK